MTDNEIIKALECCKTGDCIHCPRWKNEYISGDCSYLMNLVLNLINCQKAEIENLNKIHADSLESLRLASEANKYMSAELKAVKHKYEMATAERESNVYAYISTAEELYTLKKEYEKAVDFIKYLDRNYSSYLTEDERFGDWREKK